jgi:hypothetical protein
MPKEMLFEEGYGAALEISDIPSRKLHSLDKTLHHPHWCDCLQIPMQLLCNLELGVTRLLIGINRQTSEVGIQDS